MTVRALALVATASALVACQHVPWGLGVDQARAVEMARADAGRRHLSLKGLVLVVADDTQSWRVTFNYPTGTRRVGNDGYGWVVEKRTGAVSMLPVTE